MNKTTPLKALITTLFIFTINAMISPTQANVQNSIKLINKYKKGEDLMTQLIGSQFSSNKRTLEGNQQIITSFKQEWYKNKQGEFWYAWEEKQENTDGKWKPVNFGVVKKGHSGYIPVP